MFNTQDKKSDDHLWQELEPLDQEHKCDKTSPAPGAPSVGEGCLCPLKCRFVEYLAHPLVYAGIMNLVIVFQISAVGIYMSGTLSTIEKRFQLKSSQSGFLMTVNDITALGFVIPITYFGHRLHRPRIVACGVFFLGIGTIMCAIPQFIYDNPNKSYAGDIERNHTVLHEYCTLDYMSGNGSEECSAEDVADAGSQIGKAMWFIAGQALCGLGQSPLWPLTLTFLDDNVSKSSMPAYLAMFFTATSISPIIGYLLSAWCLSFDVDFYKSSASRNTILDPDDPNFIGAWWLGYLINGSVLCFLSSIVVLFPKVLPKRQLFKRKKRPEKNKCVKTLDFNYAAMMKGPSHSSGSTLTALLTDFLKTIQRLFTNPAYIFTVGALICELNIISGFCTFSAKYIQNQYGIPASRASLILGYVLTPAGLLGISACGYFLKKVQLTVRGYARMGVIIAITGLVTGAFLLVTGCNNPPIAGLTVTYPQSTATLTPSVHHLPNLTASCNAECSCKRGIFTPVCGADGITYVTACHAGCREMDVADYENNPEEMYYRECACIQPNLTEDDEQSTRTQVPSTLQFARLHQCQDNCQKLVAFSILYGLVFFVNAWVKNPAVMLLLRVVHEDDRSIALGFNSVAIKLLAFLPGPIYFGAAIESTCILWNESCDQTGDCLVYDLVKFRYVFIGLYITLKILSLMGFSSVTMFAERAHAKASRFQPLQTDDVTNKDEDENKNPSVKKESERVNMHQNYKHTNEHSDTEPADV